MSVTAQKMRKQAQTSNNIFPAKVNTENKSCIFVKKLLTVSISNITYLRSMFPEDAYANRSLNGLPLKILREKNKVQEAATLASWLMGAFDALERKYLKELLLIVYLDASCPDVVHEMYSFKFSYPGGKVSCQVVQGFEENEVGTMQEGDLLKSTQSLLRSIIYLTQGLGPLPASAFLSMKLMYYDEVTPEDYEPSGFKPAENRDVQLPPGCMNVSAGEIGTGHHSVKVRVQAKQLQEKEQPSIVSNNYSASASESETDPCVTVIPRARISCICQNTMPDPLMMICGYCFTQQHAACYRVTEEGKIPAVHCCVECSKESQGSRVCTDSKLVKMSTKPAVVLTCIFRRALVALINKEEMRGEFFTEKFGIGEDLVQGIIAKMMNENIVQAGDGQEHFRVHKETLETIALPRYLGVKKSDKTVESIVEKTVEMTMETEEVVKSNKRGREEEDQEIDCGPVVGSRQSKRIKRSKASKDVNLAK